MTLGQSMGLWLQLCCIWTSSALACSQLLLLGTLARKHSARVSLLDVALGTSHLRHLHAHIYETVPPHLKLARMKEPGVQTGEAEATRR